MLTFIRQYAINEVIIMIAENKGYSLDNSIHIIPLLLTIAAIITGLICTAIFCIGVITIVDTIKAYMG
jgi:hypothetical protein